MRNLREFIWQCAGENRLRGCANHQFSRNLLPRPAQFKVNSRRVCNPRSILAACALWRQFWLWKLISACISYRSLPLAQFDISRTARTDANCSCRVATFDEAIVHCETCTVKSNSRKSNNTTSISHATHSIFVGPHWRLRELTSQCTTCENWFHATQACENWIHYAACENQFHS